MDRIKVNLLSYTPLDVLLKAIGKPYKNEKPSVELLKKIAMVFKHESVLEHCNLSFEILGSSRLELQEHVRHRIGSYTVESTRYVLSKMIKEFNSIPSVNSENLIDFEESHKEIENFLQKYYVIPDVFKNDGLLNKYYGSLFLSTSLMSQLYKDDKLPQDFVKYILPESFRTRISWTVNLRSLLNFLRLRDSQTAHPEIRHIAKLVKEAIKDTYIYNIISE